MTHQQITIRFWGVRGSIPCPGPHTVRYGGNTPCVEMQVGQTRFIFDGGTGLRVLGENLRHQTPVEAHLFFTHTHWDHIQGFPFFSPAFLDGNCFHIYGTQGPEGQTLEQRLTDQMLHPNFPVPLQVMAGTLKFHQLDLHQILEIDGISITNAPLNHPGGSVGYRLDWLGLTVSYLTDTEHYPDRIDENVFKLAHQADILIYDCTYTDEEYHDPTSSKVGWGHSTWQEAVKVAKAVEAKQLVLFHHDPLHDDDFLDRVSEQVHQVFPNSVMAQESLILTLQPSDL